MKSNSVSINLALYNDSGEVTHGVQRLFVLTAILSTEIGINLYSVVVCQYILDNFVITVNISKA